jgi:FixJ family two-component response regulator
MGLAQGMNQKEIAADLGVSEATVSRHKPKSQPTVPAPPPEPIRDAA